ncbi:MAG: 7-cyano-7-deazaguanine synthase [Spirochaetes bacterium ADurb.Bin218]|nr:MAG: 7-cyano-7-deazaguanine synthase [Spirochaetes bacterium ADurb.Bin218]
MNNEKAVVLFSGGQDSTTCLFWAKEKFSEVIALNILYGQRHAIERESARKIAKLAGVELVELEMDVFSKINDSALINTDMDVSTAHDKNSNLPASFVPGRNIMLLTIAASFAYSKGISNIVTGVCQTDYSGYPDCRDKTIKSLELALSLGMDKDFHIHTPLMWKTKAETVLMATELDGCWSALALSHTCYNGQWPPCGECPACKIRARGFEEAGEIDPIFERRD